MRNNYRKKMINLPILLTTRLTTETANTLTLIIIEKGNGNDGHFVKRRCFEV